MAFAPTDASERLISSMDKQDSTLLQVLSVLLDMRSMLGVVVTTMASQSQSPDSVASPQDSKEHSSLCARMAKAKIGSASDDKSNNNNNTSINNSNSNNGAGICYCGAGGREDFDHFGIGQQPLPATIAAARHCRTQAGSHLDKDVIVNGIGVGAVRECSNARAGVGAGSVAGAGIVEGPASAPSVCTAVSSAEAPEKEEKQNRKGKKDDEEKDCHDDCNDDKSEDRDDVLGLPLPPSSPQPAHVPSRTPPHGSSLAPGVLSTYYSEALAAKMRRLDNRDSEEVSSASSLREDCWRRFSSGSEGLGLEDKFCAMETLDSMLTEQGCISPADFVACLRAFGLQAAFKEVTRRELSEGTVMLLFPEEPSATTQVSFSMFRAAMRLLEGQKPAASAASLSAASTAAAAAVAAAATLARDEEQDRELEPRPLVSSPRTNLVSFAMDRSRRRPSLFTTRSYDDFSDAIRRLGGRVAKLETSFHCLASPECLLLDPVEGPSVGVVLCLHGSLPSEALLAEWSLIMERARWRHLGMSIAIPNLQMSAALVQQDLESILESTLQLIDARRCLIVGKGWGAQKAAELADSERLGDRIDGLVLIPSGYTAPHLHDSIDVPVLLAWSQDDRIPDEDLEGEEGTACWIRTLDQCGTPILFQQTRSAELDLYQLLEDASLVSRLQLFSAASLLIAELQEADDDRNSNQLARLNQSLPSFLQTTQGARDPLRLLQTIAQWIQAGLPTATE